MDNTRITQVITDVGTGISGTCIVVDHDPNKCIFMDNTKNPLKYTSLLRGETKLIIKRANQTKYIDKEKNEEGGSDQVGDDVSARTRNEDVDSKECGSEDGSQLLITEDNLNEKLLNTVSGDEKGAQKEKIYECCHSNDEAYMMEDEKWEEYYDKVEFSEEDLEKTLILDVKINDDECRKQDTCPSRLTQLINEAREASTTNPTPMLNEVSREEEVDSVKCPECKQDVTNEKTGLRCTGCNIWYHKTCVRLTKDNVERLDKTSDQWFCRKCRANVNYVPIRSSTSFEQ